MASLVSIFTTRVVVGEAGGGGGVGACNLGVILVQVCEPVFRNLPHSYTWPLKKRTLSYTRSSEIMTPLIFCTHLLLVVRQIMQSIHWIPREQAASKISEWKICAYTGMSEKVGPFIYQLRKNRSVIYFCRRKGANHIPGSAEKGVIRHAHPYYVIYRKLPLPPPHTHMRFTINTVK